MGKDKRRAELFGELLGGAETQEDIFGPNGVIKRLTGALVERALKAELAEHLEQEDDGNDPTKFETQLLMNRLQNAQTIVKLANRLATTEARISSCAQRGVALMKPTTLKAYEIAKAVAGRVSQSELLFPAQDFYGHSASEHARTEERAEADDVVSASHN